MYSHLTKAQWCANRCNTSALFTCSVLCATWHEGTAQLTTLTEMESCLLVVFCLWLKLWTSEGVEEVAMAMLGKVCSDWSSPGLVTLQQVCLLSSAITWIPTSEQLMVWARSVLLLDWWPPPAIESNLSDQSPQAGNTFGRWVSWPHPPWPLAAFSSSSAQWCSVNTTP